MLIEDVQVAVLAVDIDRAVHVIGCGIEVMNCKQGLCGDAEPWVGNSIVRRRTSSSGSTR
jgi:hypothetical protein